ncbi:MAG: tetratricopeptide repeat protein [Rhodanobacteraceae bacterium]
MTTKLSFIAELKRRNVLRAGVLYIGAVWALAQGLAQLLPLFGDYEWIARWFVIAGIVGFPFWIAFAWFYEFTPQGLKRESEIALDDSIAHSTGRKLDKWIIVVLVVAVVLLLTNTFVWRKGAGLQPTRVSDVAVALAKIPAKSVAVLPFLDLSPGHDQGYFSDGMSEEILNALAQVKDLKVAGRTSSFYYKGRNEDLRTIGKSLGVANVLEGSVRKQDDKVRITAQLIHTDDDFHLWSESYDGDLSDVFALQERIARSITDKLKVTLIGAQKTQLVAVATTDTQAHDLYLEAREAYRARGAEMQRSIDLYHAALRRDPDFAQAWAGLCASLDVLPYYLPDTQQARLPQIYNEGEAACKRAIALDPNLAAAHVALGGLYANAWHWRAAEQQFKQAQAQAPNDPEFLFVYTDWLGAMGRSDEALATAKRAVESDPMAPAFRNLYGYLLTYNGRIDESIAQLEAGRALAPDLFYVNQNLFIAYVKAGRIQDAEQLCSILHNEVIGRGDSVTAINEYMQTIDATLAIMRQPNDYDAIRRTVSNDRIGISLIFPSHIDDLFAFVELLIDTKGSGTDGVVLLRSPLFANYRHDPRYLRLLHQTGFDDNGVPR